MTLRGRLVAVLLVLATVGLVVAGIATFVSQRSFLDDRVDQQVRSALPAVERALDAAGVAGGLDGDQPSQGQDGGPGARGGRGDGGPGPGGGGGPAPSNLPPGTYGQRRDAAGKVLGDTTLSYGQTALSKPRLPSEIERGREITVDSRQDDGPRYRVLAGRPPGARTTTVVAVPLAENDRTLDRLLVVEGLVFGFVLLVLAALAWLLVGVGLRPLDRMGKTAAKIAGGDLSHRVEPATEGTEVGRLGLALNAMLERLERAFARQRASEERLRSFLADASHELRTPLASIRGYAELFRLGAAGDEADRAKALRRIEEEAMRMGVLVEDLLTLARLDEEHEHETEPLDLALLTRDAVADARAQASDREISLELPRGEVGVTGARDRVRQVLANLLANALAHTPPGTPIEVVLLRHDETAELRVRDHGPGLPDSDFDVIFGRFWRSVRGRGRGPAGAGLGLAIVAAVVAGHGGEVSAANADGGGASFTVVLPLSGAGAPGSVAAQCAASSSPSKA